jgi:hypothetical protein
MDRCGHAEPGDHVGGKSRRRTMRTPPLHPGFVKFTLPLTVCEQRVEDSGQSFPPTNKDEWCSPQRSCRHSIGQHNATTEQRLVVAVRLDGVSARAQRDTRGHQRSRVFGWICGNRLVKGRQHTDVCSHVAMVRNVRLRCGRQSLS